MLFNCIKPIGAVLKPYNERKDALRQARTREMREAIEALRVHNGAAQRSNYIREAAFDSSGRRV